MPIFADAPPRTPNELRLDTIKGGMSIKYDQSQIRDNQSPYMPNMFFNGELSKRPGQAYSYDPSLGSGGYNGAFERFYEGLKVFAWGDGIYTQDGSEDPVKRMSGLDNSKGTFFAFNSILYYLNGTNFVQWDGSTAQNVTGYVPTLIISSPPAGGGAPFEQFNLLSSAFKTSFSGDGTATAYQLPLKGLDATAVTATVNGVNKSETTDFTVNRTSGTVTFTSAPSNGTNNVVITAYKTVSGNADRIKKCRYAIDYGGENDTRMFIWGNPDFPNRVFRCGVLDPTYWPENEFNNYGSDFEAVTVCAKHYDKLIVFKERSVFFSVFVLEDIGATFPTYPLNSAVGCDMPGSVQIIENNIVFGHSERGLMIVVSSNLKDERNIRPISGNIDGNLLRPGLLAIEKDVLQAASSVDFDGKYYICLGNVLYIWDYQISPFFNSGDTAADEERLTWYNWTNINAACWIQQDQALYYGDRDNGNMVEFIENYNDFGDPIDATWRSKVFDFGTPDLLKNINDLWYATRAGSYSSITIRYLDELSGTMESSSVNTISWSWARFRWDQFSWSVYNFASTIRLRPRVKRVVYFQLEFSNDEFNQNLSILSLIIRYFNVKKVK